MPHSFCVHIFVHDLLTTRVEQGFRQNGNGAGFTECGLFGINYEVHCLLNLGCL